MTRRATIILLADQPEEHAAFAAWMEKWEPTLTYLSENQGCGCCVDSYDIEGPAEAIAALPANICSGSSWADHEPQTHEPRDPMKPKRRIILAGLILGTLLMLAPLLGLPGRIGLPLISTDHASLLCLVGIILLVVSVAFLRRLRAASLPPMPRETCQKTPATGN